MAYNPPGVTITEYNNAVVSPLLSTADTLCLVGPTPGGITKTDLISFSSPELLSTWTNNGNWTALTSNGVNCFQHTTGATSTLTNIAAVNSTGYTVYYVIKGRTAGSVTITFGGGTSGTLSTNTSSSFSFTSSTTGAFTITPTTDFDGTIIVSVKATANTAKFVLPSIPAGGRLQSIQSVTLAESPASGNTAGTHYEPFVEEGITLTSGSATFIVPANSNPWAIGQTVTAASGIPSSTTVSDFKNNSDGTTATVTMSANASSNVTSAKIYVNSDTSSVPTQYAIVKTYAPTTTLTTIINSTDTLSGSGTVYVDSTTGWPSSGSLIIDNEVFTYTGITATTFTGVTAATNGTSRATHSVGTVVSLFTNTIARTSGSSIASGDTVYVTYTYTPSNYFNVIELDGMGDVEDRFGSAFDNNGEINSPLSFAAQVAFENGVNSVLLQPLFALGNDLVTRTQPTNAADPGAWDDTLKALQDTVNINLIVPIIGTGMTLPSNTPGATTTSTQVSTVFNKVKDYIVTMIKEHGQYTIGVVGLDGTLDASVYKNSQAVISKGNTLRINHQGQYYDEQIVFISPTVFQRPNSVSRTTAVLKVGGQYAAAAVAALAAARPVGQSLTRKNLGGFSAILDPRTKKEKNNEAASGFLVLEQVNGPVQVRHALTADITNNVSKSEFSVVRAKNYMIASLQNTVDTQLIGSVVADGNAPLVVKTTIASTLETLKQNGEIVDYSDVSARTVTINPTVIDVRFSYRPAFPVNYINIGFSVDLTTGNSTLAEANTLQLQS